MEKFDFLFEKIFALQIAKMANLPDEILTAFFSKKNTLKERLLSLGLEIKETTFVPIIPNRIMETINQMGHFFHYTQSQKGSSEIYRYYNGFFHNEHEASNLSPISEIGYIIGVDAIELSSISITESNQNEMGSALRKPLKTEGYIAANHVEAIAIANHTKIMSFDKSFCALGLSWDGFEFARVYHDMGGLLKYGLGWFSPSLKEGLIENGTNFLVPVYKEFI